MAQFKSKPTTIEAWQWNDRQAPTEMPTWLIEAINQGDAVARQNFDDGVLELRVTTIQGQWVYAKPGEWIVCEKQPGRFYPIADDVFRAKYEPV